MFNLLIVDDDQIVLDGLRRFVNWQKLGYNIIGVALSASEAVKIIEAEYVDVMLTDIVMQGKNGLELIRDAMEINPYIKTVILSGYGEFNFAKEALRLGAFDYLTKPVNFEELNDIFNKLTTVLNNELIDKKTKMEYQEVIKPQFLNNLVNGYIQDEKGILLKASEIGFGINEEFRIIRLLIDEVLNIDNSKEESEFGRLKSEISERVNEFLSEFGKAYLFSNNIKEISVLFYASDSKILDFTLDKLIEVIIANMGIKIFAGIGNSYKTIADVSKSYIEAGKAIEYRKIRKDGNFLYYQQIAGFFKGKIYITPEVEANIKEYLLAGNAKKVEEYILGLLSDINELEKSSEGIMYDACIETLIIVNKFMENCVSADKLPKQYAYNSIKNLLKKDNFSEISEFISQYIRESVSLINSDKEKPVGIIIMNVIKYIEEHYNENITLQKLSEVAFVHPIYLSKLFKEKTGGNFVDYLMKIRVEKSKKLLANASLRIYDICEMVGYDSPKHFSKVFKDFTGLTPKEFRNNLSQSEVI